jgi:PAS domain S-box-containing protein
MKILTKFIGSSVAIGSLIVSLTVVSEFLINRVDKVTEAARTRSEKSAITVLNLKVDLRDQITALRNYIILNRDPSDMAKYHKSMSDFIVTMDELESLIADKSELLVVRRRHSFLVRLGRELNDTPSSVAQTQQDLQTINSYKNDIDFSLESLINKVQQQNALSREEANRFKLTTQFIRYGSTGILLLVFASQLVLILLPVMRSIQKLQIGAAKIGAGNLDYRLYIRTEDEIEQLANDFNQMAAKLAESYRSLEQKVIERTAELTQANQNLENEIAERKQAEQAQARLTAILEATTDYVGIANAEGRVLYINRGGRKMLGISADEDLTINYIPDFMAKSVTEVTLRENMLVAAREGVWIGESALQHRDGREVPISQVIMAHKSETGEVEFMSTIARDISDRLQTEEVLRQSEARLRQQAKQLKEALKNLQQTQAQLIQTEKMSSLGQLVAGVAHEINNPVNFIHGNVTHADEYTKDLLEIIQLYQQYYPHPVPEIQERTEEIDFDFLKQDLPKALSSMKFGTERIREIVLSLRNFSRLDESEMKAVNIHDGIESTLLILQNRLKAKPNHPAIEIVKNYGRLPNVQCYPGQLNQVFMNIINNAIDALDSYNNNRSAEEIRANPSAITIRTEMRDSNDVIVRISDNGPGMTEEVKKRLFDPFFTTKPVGSGTGLGLSISYQIIVDKHRGAICCESTLGQGTEFLIQIPVLQRAGLSDSTVKSTANV